MAANFERWFNEKYGKNQSYGRGVAFEAWNAAIKSVVEPFTSYNSQSVTALSEIVWDWLTENAVDVMVDECDVNILIQRLNSGVPELHT